MAHVASNIRCLISAGPTREYFDPVRFISNPSSGRMGYAIAESAVSNGWDTCLVSGPVSLTAPKDARIHNVVSGEDMHDALSREFTTCDILIMTAAICDFRPKIRHSEKIKKAQAETTIDFEPVPDILKSLSARKNKQTLVGFAAETEKVPEYAMKKLAEKSLDYIVANDVSTPYGFESGDNHVWLFDKNGLTEEWGPEPKSVIAAKLIHFLKTKLAHAGT